MVVGDIVAQYKSEGFHGETMRVEMTPVDPNKYGFDLVFRMTETASAREVARGKVGVVLWPAASARWRLFPRRCGWRCSAPDPQTRPLA